MEQSYSGARRLAQLASKELKKCARSCRSAQLDLESAGYNEIAKDLDAIVSRLEILIDVKVAPIIGVKKIKSISGDSKPVKRTHQLEQPFLELWKKAFPNYVLSNDDWRMMREMFKALDRNFPQPSIEFLKKGIINYKSSTIEWVVDYGYELKIFCKHFPRQFSTKPMLKIEVEAIKGY